MTSLFLDPLEQFSIEVFQSYFSFLNFDSNFKKTCWNFFNVPSTSITKMVILNFSLLILLIYSLKPVFITNKVQLIFLSSFLFITGILKDSVLIKKYSFMLLIYTTFMFLCLSNLLGMFPYSMTVTSHLILTLFFSLAFFMGSNVIGICYNKKSFFSLFLPEGVPLMIIPFLILIEYVSYISSMFSLAISLFANMLSGHILLKILISFVWAIVSSTMVHWFWNILPMSIVFSVMGLELSIAFLQAYVFIVLATLYLKDVVHPH